MIFSDWITWNMTEIRCYNFIIVAQSDNGFQVTRAIHDMAHYEIWPF